MKIATKTQRHKGILFFLNLVPWCLCGYFHVRNVNFYKS